MKARAQFPVLRLGAAIACFALVSSAQQPTAAHAQLPGPVAGALSQGWDALVKPVLGLSFGDAKKGIAAALSGGKDLAKQLEPLMAGFKNTKVLQQKLFAGAEALLSLPEKLKAKFKALIWVEDENMWPTSPVDTRNDKAIGQILRGEVKGFFALKPFSIVPKALRDWLVSAGGQVVATLGTPVIRFMQFVRGKVKLAAQVVIRHVMKGAVGLEAQLKKLNVPPFLIAAFKSGADLLGRLVGSLGSYVLNLSPKLKSVVMDVVDMLANTAEPLNDALSSMSGLAAVMGGDERVTLDEAGTKELAAALKKIRAKRGTPAYKAARQAARAEVMAARYRAAFGLKEEKVRAAMTRILDAIAQAFGAFARPALEQVASLLNMAMQPVVSLLIRAIGAVLDCIPWAGGVISAFWTSLAPIGAQLLGDIVPKILIGVAVEFVEDELKDFTKFFVDMWAGRKGKGDQQLMGDFMKAMQRFQEIFKTATTGLFALRDGLNKGAAALFEGPVVAAILKKLPLPHSLLEAVAAAIGAALETAFRPGKLNLDPKAIALAVINSEKLQSAVERFITEDKLFPIPGSLKAALAKGLRGGWTTIGKAIASKGFGALLQGNVILNVIADAIDGGKADFARFIAEGIPICGIQTGVEVAATGVAKLLRAGKDIPRLLGKGLKSLIPAIVRDAAPALREFLSCQITHEKFRALVVPAVDAAADFFSEEKNIDALMKGGPKAFVALGLRIAAQPIGTLLADGLNDALLAGELATSIRGLADSVNDNSILDAFKKSGMKGALFLLAQRFKAPIVGALSRKVRDPEFGEALLASYDNVVQTLGADKLTKEGLVGIFVPWAQLAFKKSIDAFGVALDKGKEKLAAFIDGFRGKIPFIGGLREVVIAASEAGRVRFVELARPCAAEMTTEVGDSFKKVVTCTIDAGTQAFKAGAAAGAKAALIGAIEAFGESLDAGKEKLQAFIAAQSVKGLPPFIAQLKEVAIAAAGAGADAGRAKFVEEGRACAEKITEESAADVKAVQAALGEVATCLAKAAQSAFGAAASGAVSPATQGTPEDATKTAEPTDAPPEGQE